MKKIKALTSALLAAAMALSMTGCVEETPTSGAQPGGTPAQGTPATTTTTETHAENSGVNSAVGDISATALDNPDLKVTKRIKWLAWWPIDETTAAPKLFESVYGIPETGDDPESAGQIFENINVAYGDRYTKLGASIAADDSPDLFPFEALDFPYGVLKGRYQAIDDIVDLSTSKWDATRDLMELYSFNGKHYCAFYEISLNNMMYYRTSMIDEIGVEDPRKTFEEGNWNWDTFLEIARKWKDSRENRYVIDGFNPENDFVLSTGTPIVGNDGTQLINNMYEANVERAINELIGTLQKENLRYPRHELNGWGVNPKAWADGDILFYCDGALWVWENTLTKYAKKNGWSDDEVKFVPFPKDPQADKHYVTLKQDALMWCKGSKNEEGVRAYIDCCATVAQDETVREAGILQAIENYNWSRDNLDFYYSLVALDGSSPVTPAVDFKGGLGAVSDGSATENPIQSLTNLPYLTGETYTQQREMHNPAIQAAIDDINKALAEG